MIIILLVIHAGLGPNTKKRVQLTFYLVYTIFNHDLVNTTYSVLRWNSNIPDLIEMT